MNWRKIKAEYISTDISYRKLAEKHGVPFRTLADRAKREGWVGLREQACAKTVTTVVNATVDKQVDRIKRLQDVTDKLLEKIEEAVEQLDITLSTNTEKVKVIEYNNALRPDKPTKETITENETVVETRTIIDRSGLKAITSALRDIKEVQMLKSELDKQEQEARIAKLRKDAEDEETDTKMEVTFTGGDVEEWSE